MMEFQESGFFECHVSEQRKIKINLTIFFEGFGQWTHEDETQKKFLFDGCGFVNGFMGAVFVQVSQVVQKCQEMLGNGNKVRVVAIGLSRGGCIYLIASL